MKDENKSAKLATDMHTSEVRRFLSMKARRLQACCTAQLAELIVEEFQDAS